MGSLSPKQKKIAKISISDSNKGCASTAQGWDAGLCPRRHGQTSELQGDEGPLSSAGQLPKNKAAAATMFCPAPHTLPAPWGPMLTKKCKHGPKCSAFDCTETKKKLTGYGNTATNCCLLQAEASMLFYPAGWKDRNGCCFLTSMFLEVWLKEI